MKRIIFTIITVIYVIFFIYWIWWFFIAGVNVSFVFATMAKIGGAELKPDGEFDLTKATAIGKGGVIVARGGGLVDFLFFLLMLTLTFIIERALNMNQARGKMPFVKFIFELKKLVTQRKIDEAIELSKRQGGAFGKLAMSGLERYKSLPVKDDLQRVKEELREAFSEQSAIEGALLERRLIAIATIASIATMTGLLGTVVGMIRAFAALSAKGRPDPNQLATGISEALVNTAGGLLTAIISIIFYNFFVNKVDIFNFQMEEITTDVIEELIRR
ncbi:MAG: MotA/TolQ/ExbB proton channel family protein [bacterium]